MAASSASMPGWFCDVGGAMRTRSIVPSTAKSYQCRQMRRGALVTETDARAGHDAAVRCLSGQISRKPVKVTWQNNSVYQNCKLCFSRPVPPKRLADRELSRTRCGMWWTRQRRREKAMAGRMED